MIEARRFWTDVRVAPEPGGFGVLLDGRPLRTPGQAALRAPSLALAEAIAAEWRAIEGVVRPEALPFTRAANTAIDRIAPDPDPVVDYIAAYGEADLLCYRAAEPEGLRLRQAVAWDPLLEWSARALKAPLHALEGVMHHAQPGPSVAALRAAVAEHGAFALAGLYDLVTLSGSVVIGLAVSRGEARAEAAWALSRIDEDWQAEQWGRDAEAEAAAARRREDFLRAAGLLEMLAGAAPAAPAG